MQINKFKLVDSGYNGIEIDAIVSNVKGKLTILDQEKRLRKVSIPAKLRDDIQKLRYALLAASGFWNQSYNKMFDFELMCPVPYTGKGDTPDDMIFFRDLWNRSLVTGVTIKNQSFLISGTISCLGDKKIALNTPLVSEDDEMHFFTETAEIIHEILQDIAQYFESDTNILPEAKEYLMRMFKDKEDEVSRIESQSESENVEEMMLHLERLGAVVIMPPAAITDGNPKEDKKTKVSKNTKTVNEARYQESEENVKTDSKEESVEVQEEYKREEETVNESEQDNNW